jgi:hypothetical protein
MTGTKKAWQDVGERFEALGLKLKLHLEEERADRDEIESTGVREALDKAAAALDDVFDALGEAAEDVAVKNDLKELASSFGSAMESTFDDLGARLQGYFDKR